MKRKLKMLMKRGTCCLLTATMVISACSMKTVAEPKKNNVDEEECFRILETDEEGRIVSAVSCGEYLTREYDGDEKMIEYLSEEPFDGTNYYNKTTTEYLSDSEIGSVKRVTVEQGNTVSVGEYDANNNCTKDILEGGLTRVTKYDSDSHITETTYPYTGTTEDIFNTTRYEYDELGHNIETYIPVGERTDGSVAYDITKNSYDKNGNLISECHTVNAMDEEQTFVRTEYSYDDKNQLVKTTEYDVDGTVAAIAQYYYDKEGHKVRQYTGLTAPLTITGLDQVISGGDNEYGVTKYVYDGDYLISETNPEGNTISYQYNADGLMSEKTEADGTRHVYTYRDSLYRESEKVYNKQKGDNLIESIDYVQEKEISGEWGMLTKIKSKAGETSYKYNENGYLVSEKDPNGNVVDYSYDAESRLVGIEVKNQKGKKIGSEKFEYDAQGKLTKISDASNKEVASYKYDNQNRLNKKTLGNGIETTYHFNKSGLASGFKMQKDTEILSDVQYDYSVNGNIICETDLVNNNITTYDYDGLNRISRVESGGKDTQYKYDESGNCTAVIAENTISNSFDKANRIVESNGESVKYDLKGNMIQKGNTLYTYDYNNRLICVEEDDNKTEYKYDVYGKLIGRSFNGKQEQYIWANEQIIAKIGEEDEFYFNDASGAVAVLKGGNKNYLLKGKRGDIISVTTEDTTTISESEYSPFGLEIDSDESVSGNTMELGYTGSFQDDATGLVYLNARFYSPELGAFMTEDSIAGKEDEVMTLNRYAYCNNNPVNYVDKSGHWSIATHRTMSSWALTQNNCSDATLSNCVYYTARWADVYFHYGADSEEEGIQLKPAALTRLNMAELRGYVDEEHYVNNTIHHTKSSRYHGKGYYESTLAYMMGLALQFKKGYQIQSLTLRNDDMVYKQINFDLLIRLCSLYVGEADDFVGQTMSRNIYSYLILGMGLHLSEDMWAHAAIVTTEELRAVKDKLFKYAGLVEFNKKHNFSCVKVKKFAKNGVEITDQELCESTTIPRAIERNSAARNAAKKYASFWSNGTIMYSSSQQLQGSSSATATDVQNLRIVSCPNSIHNVPNVVIYNYIDIKRPEYQEYIRDGKDITKYSLKSGPYICTTCQSGASDNCNRMFYSNISSTYNKPELGYSQ